MAALSSGPRLFCCMRSLRVIDRQAVLFFDVPDFKCKRSTLVEDAQQLVIQSVDFFADGVDIQISCPLFSGFGQPFSGPQAAPGIIVSCLQCSSSRCG